MTPPAPVPHRLPSITRHWVVVWMVVLASVGHASPLEAQAAQQASSGSARPMAVDPRTIDAYVEAAMREWQVPGVAIAVVRNDSVVLAKGYGVRELGKSDRVTPNSLFAIGSTSKAFTAAALGILVDEGKLRWDDPVSKYLPNLQLYDPYVTRELTIRDLLTHRSGLSRGDALWHASGNDRAEVLRRVRFLKPSWSFRSAYGYQNIMFLAAGEVVAAVSGKSWDDFVRERFFGPQRDWSTILLATAKRAQDRAAEERRKLEAARATGTTPSVAHEKYAGTYADSMYGEVKIVVENGKLTAMRGPQYVGELRHWQHDTFEAQWREAALGRTFVTFALDPRGNVKGLEIENLATFGRVVADSAAVRR